MYNYYCDDAVYYHDGVVNYCDAIVNYSVGKIRSIKDDEGN